MLITTHWDLVASRLRNGGKTAMQNHRPTAANSTATGKSCSSSSVAGPSVQSRPATDFSIEAIMGRSNETERPSPKIASTAECPQSPKCSGSQMAGNRLLSATQFSAFASLPRESRIHSESPSSSRAECVSPPLSPGLEDFSVLSSRSVTLPNPRSPVESCDGSRSPTNSEMTAGSIEGDIVRPRSASPVRSTPSPSNSNCSTKEASNACSSGPNPFAEALKPRCNCEELSRVDCHLENKDLWDKFNDLGTEMIITKSGRYERSMKTMKHAKLSDVMPRAHSMSIRKHIVRFSLSEPIRSSVIASASVLPIAEFSPTGSRG
ncbi:t-box transcription factor tbx20-like protein [Dinothrombium tinctorium]|uniref:T-box transcription factor tbx20-like protein n=1 Tax=Dinothrombium tinctorium TaxID=1965070 RepID=A0A443RR89_9ACAR|nr:t-box transcription factor tbx20-like protein [Dinothrombium tinctorium]